MSLSKYYSSSRSSITESVLVLVVVEPTAIAAESQTPALSFIANCASLIWHKRGPVSPHEVITGSVVANCKVAMSIRTQCVFRDVDIGMKRYFTVAPQVGELH